MELEVTHYTKIIKGYTILEDINLSLTSGHIYGFSGRNGVGKSMLFKAITGIILPTKGDVILDHKSIIYDDIDLRIFGTLIEHPEFYDNLSGFDNLMLLYRINHQPDTILIKQQLKKFGLEGHEYKKYKTYSLGMRQRLRLAQAMMENQKIIVLDEAFNGIDKEGVQDLYEILKEEREKGKLILISSHNEKDLEICDQIFYMSQGKLIENQGMFI